MSPFTKAKQTVSLKRITKITPIRLDRQTRYKLNNAADHFFRKH